MGSLTARTGSTQNHARHCQSQDPRPRDGASLSDFSRTVLALTSAAAWRRAIGRSNESRSYIQSYCQDYSTESVLPARCRFFSHLEWPAVLPSVATSKAAPHFHHKAASNSSSIKEAEFGGGGVGAYAAEPPSHLWFTFPFHNLTAILPEGGCPACSSVGVDSTQQRLCGLPPKGSLGVNGNVQPRLLCAPSVEPVEPVSVANSGEAGIAGGGYRGYTCTRRVLGMCYNRGALFPTASKSACKDDSKIFGAVCVRLAYHSSKRATVNRKREHTRGWPIML